MNLRTCAEILFGVCEEIVGTGADEVGSAYLWIGDGELSCAGGCAGSHELFCRNVSIRRRINKRCPRTRSSISIPRSFLCSAAMLDMATKFATMRL